ncbi:MAG TPA: NAD(P)/FAD-dependent oxidoreductase [Candidatus Saccharimonadales bacterium]|nr:NAD(P)/FAD-dependent oxidoreductase [Candidatus Saccharimonadales bacterium]
MSSNNTNVLIVGGGFGGIKAALELSKSSHVNVTLVSDHGHFRYYPALYHTATGGRRTGSRIAISELLAGHHVQFVRARATKLDREKKEIITEDGQHLAYDVLVMALGNVTNYFGIKGLPEYSYGIKTTEEAERFKKHLHEQIAAGGPDQNYVVVGGGPTGIELAGGLPEYLKRIMKNHGAKTDAPLNIKLVEALPTLLPRSPKKISEAVTKRLEGLGITIMTNAAVKEQTADSLIVGDSSIPTTTVIWTAGVTNNPFFQDNGFKMTDRHKVEVNEFMQAEENIYVLGDNANTPFSGMAQTALHDGEVVAGNIARIAAGKAPVAYKPKKPISVIPVGRNWAALEWGSITTSGLVGGFLHLFVDLIGFHDLQNWPKATGQWMRSKKEGDQEVCALCADK